MNVLVLLALVRYLRALGILFPENFKPFIFNRMIMGFNVKAFIFLCAILLPLMHLSLKQLCFLLIAFQQLWLFNEWNSWKISWSILFLIQINWLLQITLLSWCQHNFLRGLILSKVIFHIFYVHNLSLGHFFPFSHKPLLRENSWWQI